jgi:hypothetical protein
MTKRKTGNILLLAGSLLLLAFAVFKTSQRASSGKPTAVQDSIAVVTFQTAAGWGYTVNVGAHAYIYQDFIPAIPGRTPFHSKEDAQRVGNRVAEKLRKQQVPAISKQELTEMGIVVHGQ